ncbi:unnamed protein product [Paramecium sonneborni]|uniref:Uncharacterized protein n=1 Tax=Paramecium sonneborni TaxID=65129 RepID=A0A8S1QPK3_9CILI|nr:unnamed protein product [Paramecium sonneborni]
MKTAFTDYISVLNQDKPFLIEEFSIIEAKNEEGIVYRWSAWFQYLPLSPTINAQKIGILDSNCYHLFSSVDKKSKNLNFLHYDCQNPIEMKIQKIIKFIGSDKLQYSFEMNINNFEYENQWYYFDFIYFLYNKKFQIIFIKNEQIIKDEILNILPFEDLSLLQKIGGDLIVEDSKIIDISKGDIFATFPGKIMPIFSDNNIKNFALAANSLAKSQKVCRCQSNPVKTLVDSDFYELNTLIYTSKFANCNSFIFSGWFKINEIIKTDQEMTFQFIKLSSNMQNSQLQNQNLSPLQLFYKLSKDTNRVVLTTYSYTFPSVTLDFTNDPFLINQEFYINNNISLWHLLYVRLIEDKLDIIIKFYEKQQVFEYTAQLVVKQFHSIYYKLFLGNFLQQTNYLNIIGRNLYFFNCNENFQQKNCHKSCGECDGPTYQDCLSCSEESKRIYIPEYKQCICPYNRIDSEDKCMDYSDFNFKLISNIEQNDDCIYGYFELNGICYQCPGQINSETKACLECLLNPKDWQKNPICQTDLFLKKDGSTSELDKNYYLKQYFTFNGLDLELCSECEELSLTDEQNINLDFLLKVQSFKQFCINEIPSDQCYRCINNCLTCAVLMTGEVCLTCFNAGQLQNGKCIYQTLGKQEQNNCLSPNYITYSKECTRCTIDHCIYCFDYVSDDLTLSTLYKNFQKFSGDENLKVGCAMCEDEYIFDFQIGLCQKQSSNIESCIRSYINLEGIEKCTLSSKQDFTISREIFNCEKLISNCIQCFLTVQSVLKCIICKEGYTSSTIEQKTIFYYQYRRKYQFQRCMGIKDTKLYGIIFTKLILLFNALINLLN